MSKQCLKCEKPIDMAVEQNIPVCHNCRMEFKVFKNLVDFLAKMPVDHPERNYLIGSQISDRKSFMFSCNPKKSQIYEQMMFEIDNLNLIQANMPQIAKETLKIIEKPIVEPQSPIQLVATP